ncbi:MAG: TPM domain-containing protein, partial [Atopobiaceae bacterium]|nr:TPM domain-containing protein [Atopobiaceae bacterium]
MRRMNMFLAPALLLTMAFVWAILPTTALAAGTFRVDDQAELLSSAEASKLQSDYAELTEFVDAAFVTTTKESSDVEVFAESYITSAFGSDPAVIFVIDMYNRQICVYSNDAGLEYVTREDARAIADNVYGFAGEGDYYGCADAAFRQVLAKCQGGDIARPVKHITNFLIAVVFGVLINFFFVYHSRAKVMRQRASAKSMRGMASMPAIVRTKPTLINRVRHYR